MICYGQVNNMCKSGMEKVRTRRLFLHQIYRVLSKYRGSPVSPSAYCRVPHKQVAFWDPRFTPFAGALALLGGFADQHDRYGHCGHRGKQESGGIAAG
jgi:hypothetical protein